MRMEWMTVCEPLKYRDMSSSMGSLTPSEDLSEGLVMMETSVRRQGKANKARGVTTNVLPDDVLLYIFDFYPGGDVDFTLEKWKPLLDVCKRWRSIITGSPQRLHLSLAFTRRTPRELLDIWPSLPIDVYYRSTFELSGDDFDMNIVAALERHDRVSKIQFIGLTNSVLKRFASVMQDPFPQLINVRLHADAHDRREMNTDKTALVIPDAFLGGCAPRLERFLMWDIAYPGLPNLISSTSNLVDLYLSDIPHAGYISPEAMAACLATLPKLKEIYIGFQSSQSRPDHRSPPPLTRSVIPALTEFQFQGVSDYLEELVARIDAPLLGRFNVTYLTEIISGIPQLYEFITRSGYVLVWPSAKVEFAPPFAGIRFGGIDLRVRCKSLRRVVSSMAQLCGQLSPLLFPIVFLKFREYSDYRGGVHEDMESAQWLGLFRPFASVEILDVYEKLAPLVAHALKELTDDESAARVLPALGHLTLRERESSGSRETLEPFLAARRRADRPVHVFLTGLEESWGADGDL